MKVFALVLCLVGVAYAKVSLEAVLLAKWSNFKASHGKVYSAEEEPKRLQAFMQNTLHVELHNERHAQGLETYTLGHNEFSDLTIEEFKAIHTGLKAPPSFDNATVHRVSGRLAAPASADWRGHLPGVKNQGGCGSCYAFAALAPLEGAIARRGRRVSLSEQEVVDCSSGYGNGGCNGGWLSNVYNYVKAANGIAHESAYGYKGAVQQCQKRGERVGSLNGYRTVNNEGAMVDALGSVGPVAIAVQAGVRSFQLYKNGIYNDRNCGTGGVDHGVALVGYGNSGGQTYYILRNSWGSGWGEGGYMRIARNINHVNEFGHYPVLS